MTVVVVQAVRGTRDKPEGWTAKITAYLRRPPIPADFEGMDEVVIDPEAPIRREEWWPISFEDARGIVAKMEANEELVSTFQGQVRKLSDDPPSHDLEPPLWSWECAEARRG